MNKTLTRRGGATAIYSHRATLGVYLPLLRATVLLLAYAIMTPAFSSVVYRTVGGNCVDSNHAEVVYGVDEYGSTIYGVGPKVCPDNAAYAELKLLDSYVPGTSFSESFYGSEDDIVESFYFFDGINGTSYVRGQGVALGFGGINGMMPAVSGGGFVDLTLFTSRVTGGYFYSEGGPGGCYMGSTEGPYPEGNCLPASSGQGWNAYSSATIFAGWMRVSEPSTYTLVAFALILLAVASRGTTVARNDA
jgi:hypothetical protein